MAHHKRRKRRKGGIKGHCFLCSLEKNGGRRNGRIPSIQEVKFHLKFKEETKQLGFSLKKRVNNGYWFPPRR